MNFKMGITLREKWKYCILFNDTFSNSSVPCREQNYSVLILVICLIYICLRKDGCVLLMNWKTVVC